MPTFLLTGRNAKGQPDAMHLDAATKAEAMMRANGQRFTVEGVEEIVPHMDAPPLDRIADCALVRSPFATIALAAFVGTLGSSIVGWLVIWVISSNR